MHCNAAHVASTDPHLLIHVEGTRLGQRIQFSCSDGFKLNGLKNSTCQASGIFNLHETFFEIFFSPGIWNTDAPQCLPVTCPKLEVASDSAVKILKQETQYGGRAVFQCPPGHKLIGASILICDQNELWNGAIPECKGKFLFFLIKRLTLIFKEIFCTPPLIPQNGKLEFSNESSTSPYGVGSSVTFSCKDFHQLVGERTIVCTDAGFWSNPPPFCKNITNL